jgi:16S rRNA (guanine527-N7)-methyltransferase
VASSPLFSAELWAAIEQSRAYGFLGPGALEPVAQHATVFFIVAERFVASEALSTARILDLGSGGGVPGLIGVELLPRSQWILLDAMAKRTAFLREAVASLGAADRVTVLTGRAEELARLHTGEIDVMVSRGFGPPAVTIECAARFLCENGILVVSEPPASRGVRWDGLARTNLGMEFLGCQTVEQALEEQSGDRADETIDVESRTTTFSVFRKVRATPELYPRSGKALAKKPLFD